MLGARSHPTTEKTLEQSARPYSVAGFKVGALMIDASLFVPQSRPRLFVVCSRNGTPIPERFTTQLAQPPWHTKIVRAYNELPASAKSNWIWWHLPMPPRRTTSFADLIEESPA